MGMKLIVRLGIILVLSIAAVHSSYGADDCGELPLCPGYGDDQPGITCCLQVPFDGGVALMFAAGGIGMWVRAIRKKKLANS